MRDNLFVPFSDNEDFTDFMDSDDGIAQISQEGMIHMTPEEPEQ